MLRLLIENLISALLTAPHPSHERRRRRTITALGQSLLILGLAIEIWVTAYGVRRELGELRGRVDRIESALMSRRSEEAARALDGGPYLSPGAERFTSARAGQ